MLIALLALLGVDLIVMVALVAFVISRKRWVKRQPGAFIAAIRVSSGEVDGLKPKWKRGYARWVRDILVWTKGPFLLRNEFIPVDHVDEPGPADPRQVKRLGKRPVAIQIMTRSATVEAAAHRNDTELLRGPRRMSANGMVSTSIRLAASKEL